MPDTYTPVEESAPPSPPQEVQGAGAPPITAAYIRDRYNKWSTALRKETYDYWLARAMLAGEQWLYWDQVRNSLQQLTKDPARVRVVVNRLWPTSRALMAKLLSRQLRFEVPPGDTDDATIRGAHIGQAVLSHLHRDHNWEDFREQHAWATWIGGTAGLCLDWNPSAGTSLGISPTTGMPIGTGDIEETVVSIVEMAIEPGSRDAEKATCWIRAQALPPQVVQERYRLPKLPAADIVAGMSPQQQRLVQGERRESRTELTLVLTYYERPNSLRPRGAVVTVVGNKIVDGPKPWPFPFKDRLNLVIARETKVPGRWTGDTVLQAAIPIQVAYNASWSNIIEHMKLAGNARLLIPEGSVDMIDELTDLPSEILPYIPAGGVPSYLSPPQMPQWWIEQPIQLANQMDDTLGFHDVSRGEAPRNVESGLGLSILAEADATPIGHLTKEIAEAWGRFSSLVLQVYADKVTETRTARLQTEGGIPETVTWSGASLQGQTHAVVPLDAVMPRSRAAMLAFARELWDRKIVQDPAQFAKIADFERQDQFLEGLDHDLTRARRENHLMAMGEIPLPADFDDHAVHIKEHNCLRKSVRYEAMSPEMREIVDKHIQGHEVMAAEEAGKMAARMAANPALGMAPTGAEIPVPGAPPAGGLSGPNFPQPLEPLQPRSGPGGA